MERSGALLLVVAALAAAAPGRADAQVMSVEGCRTESSRLAEALGVVPRPDLEDGAFVVATASGCSLLPVRHDRSVREPLGRAIDEARAGRALADRERVILYVNGMAVTPEIHCASLRGIAAATGATVVGVHNATEGFGRDLLQVLVQRELIAQRRANGPLAKLGATRHGPVATLRRVIVSAALDRSPAPEIWAHSQGGAITSLAIYEARDVLDDHGAKLGGPTTLPPLEVVTFASAAPFWPSGPRYEHYVHGEDAVPRYTGLGRFDWFDDRKAGASATVIRFSGERFVAAGEARAAGAPDLSHHDILEIYLPRYLREHGGRPATLLPWRAP